MASTLRGLSSLWLELPLENGDKEICQGRSSDEFMNVPPVPSLLYN